MSGAFLPPGMPPDRLVSITVDYSFPPSLEMKLEQVMFTAELSHFPKIEMITTDQEDGSKKRKLIAVFEIEEARFRPIDAQGRPIDRPPLFRFVH
jgi:hypothetical protein